MFLMEVVCRWEILNDAKTPYGCAADHHAMQRKAYEVQDGKDSLKFECKVRLFVCFVMLTDLVLICSLQALPKLAELSSPVTALGYSLPNAGPPPGSLRPLPPASAEFFRVKADFSRPLCKHIPEARTRSYGN